MVESRDSRHSVKPRGAVHASLQPDGAAERRDNGCGAGVAFFITIRGGATAGAVSAWRSFLAFLARFSSPLF
jgi:hypothetical protein